MNAPDDAASEAMEALQCLSARLLDGGLSAAKLAMNWIRLTPKEAAVAMRRHIALSKNPADASCVAAVRGILDIYEASLSDEDRAKQLRKDRNTTRAKARAAIAGRNEVLPSQEWTRDTILEQARLRRDVLACALMAIDRGLDQNGAILTDLYEYFTKPGRCIESLRYSCKRAGLTAVASNVVPFVPTKRGAS
jgi:hypothetical protein